MQREMKQGLHVCISELVRNINLALNNRWFAPTFTCGGNTKGTCDIKRDRGGKLLVCIQWCLQLVYGIYET